jgi:hypothetical protein
MKSHLIAAIACLANLPLLAGCSSGDNQKQAPEGASAAVAQGYSTDDPCGCNYQDFPACDAAVNQCVLQGVAQCNQIPPWEFAQYNRCQDEVSRACDALAYACLDQALDACQAACAPPPPPCGYIGGMSCN